MDDNPCESESQAVRICEWPGTDAGSRLDGPHTQARRELRPQERYLGAEGELKRRRRLTAQ